MSARKPRLEDFLVAAHARARIRLSDERLDPEQRELLARVFARYDKKTSASPASDPAAVFHFICSANGVDPSEKLLQLAAFGILYLLSADLFDDVQDGELEGGVHAEVGAPIAINNAITMLALALESLRVAMELEADPRRRMAYLELFNRISIEAVVGQHRDLSSANRAGSSASALEINTAKTSSLALLAEAAALGAGCGDDLVRSYREAGRSMSAIVQLVDDVRDVFGKRDGTDLAGGKRTYPIARFFELADESARRRLASLILGLPDTLREIRAMMYEAGVVTSCAEEIEKARARLHGSLAATGARASGHRMWLQLADTLAATVYQVPELEESEAILRPRGGWHDEVRDEAAVIASRIDAAQATPVPLRPWHRTQWMYDPRLRTVFYADIESQGEEVLPAQAAMLGTDDLEAAAATVRRMLPSVLAHELFHAWRHLRALLTDDWWLEELVANRLAAAYVQAHHPGLEGAVAGVAARVIEAADVDLSPPARAVLTSLFDGDPTPRARLDGYGLDTNQLVLVQAHMVRRIHAERLDLDREVSRWLVA